MRPVSDEVIQALSAAPAKLTQEQARSILARWVTSENKMSKTMSEVIDDVARGNVDVDSDAIELAAARERSAKNAHGNFDKYVALMMRSARANDGVLRALVKADFATHESELSSVGLKKAADECGQGFPADAAQPDLRSDGHTMRARDGRELFAAAPQTERDDEAISGAPKGQNYSAKPSQPIAGNGGQHGHATKGPAGNASVPRDPNPELEAARQRERAQSMIFRTTTICGIALCDLPVANLDGLEKRSRFESELAREIRIKAGVGASNMTVMQAISAKMLRACIATAKAKCGESVQ